MALRNLLVRIGADISGMQSGMDKASAKVKGFSDTVGKTMGGLKGKIAGALAALGAGAFVHSGIQDAIEYEALMGTLSETLGGSIKDFQKWQESTGASMGFSKLAGARLANTLALNFKRISTSQADLTNKTTKMMEVAAIISNKRGMSMTEVSDRIRSAMNQEADGADELGLNVRVAAVQMSDAYKRMGVSGPWDKLSQNMRQTILYNYILEETTKNLGSSLQDNTQLRLSQFTAALGNVRLALGQAFLPIIYTILPYLTAFMNAIATALGYVYAFTRALFGTPKAGKATAQAVQKQTTALGGQSKALDNVGKSAGKAAKAVNKAAKAGDNLQSFDEVHLLDKATSDTGGDTGAGGGGGGGGGPAVPVPAVETPGTSGLFGDALGWMDKIDKKVQDLATKFKNWLRDSEGWKTIKQGLHDVWQGLKDIWNSKAMQGFIKAFEKDLPDFFNSLGDIGGGVLKLLGGSLEGIAGFLNGDSKQAWDGLGQQLSGIWDIFTGSVGLIFPDLGKKMEKAGNSFDKTWDWFGKNFVTKTSTFSSTWGGFTDYLKSKYGTKVTALTLEGVSKFGELKTKTTKSVSDSVTDFIAKYTGFGKSTKGTLDWIKKNHDSIFEGIKGIIKKKMEDAWKDFTAPFSNVGSWFTKHVATPIHDALHGVGKSSDSAFGTALRNTYNNIAKKINGMLGGLASVGAGGIYPFTGVTRWALPPLAKGGITTGPMAAWIGDNPGGHEVVAPLDKLRGMIAETLLDVLRVQGGGGGGDIVLNLDGRTFARIINPHIQKEQKRVGNNIRMNPI